MHRVAEPDRVGHRVAETIVHRRQAGRLEIAQPAHLERCRLACDYQQPIVTGMTGKIDKNINAVAVNATRHGRIIHPMYIVPVRGKRLQAARTLVMDRGTGITGDIEPFPVVMLKQGLKKGERGVITKIAGQVGQPDRSRGVPRLRGQPGDVVSMTPRPLFSLAMYQFHASTTSA